MALFDRSMHELREAHVRARFGESVGFHDAHIETWLKRQRSERQPSYARWREYLSRPWPNMYEGLSTSALVLLGKATPLGAMTGREKGLPSPFWRLYETIAYGRTDRHLYAGESEGVFSINTHFSFLYREVDHELIIEPVFDFKEAKVLKVVLFILLMEWKCNRSHWMSARAYLCEVLEQAVKQQRAYAEQAFDQAVAVSSDGLKVMLADWVVVRETRETLRVYRAASFAARKIRLIDRIADADMGHGIVSMSHPMNVETPIDVAHAYGQGTYRFDHSRCDPALQLVGVCRNRNGLERVLVTVPEWCPDPLPEGEVDLTMFTKPTRLDAEDGNPL